MVTTRPATEIDLSFLEEVFLRAKRPHITATRGFWDEAKELNQFRPQLELEYTCLIKLDHVAIGFFMTLERGRDVEPHTICIAPEYQGRGLGTTIVRRLLSHAQDQRRGVHLSVLKPNKAALSLYERLGFVITGETDHHYQMSLGS